MKTNCPSIDHLIKIKLYNQCFDKNNYSLNYEHCSQSINCHNLVVLPAGKMLSIFASLNMINEHFVKNLAKFDSKKRPSTMSTRKTFFIANNSLHFDSLFHRENGFNYEYSLSFNRVHFAYHFHNSL